MENIKQINFTIQNLESNCFHCGDSCGNSHIFSEGKRFCCNGCKMVYELLSSNEMCDYYNNAEPPGISPPEAGSQTKFKYLEDESIRKKLVNFSDGNTASITFYVPAMHCSSCIWLLENLVRLNPLVHSSRVNYLKKEVQITFEETASSLRQMVELLASLGYEPQINLQDLHRKEDHDSNRSLYIKIGIAGFSFGNIMLLRFPEYLSGGVVIQDNLNNFFNYLAILLAIPVLFYSSQDYFKSAITAFRQKIVNMDVPISLGILTLVVRSIYEIISKTGPGYLDSFAGLVLFLLIGKLFEKKTYDALSFERDYKSYFPVAVTKKDKNGESSIPLEKLKVGDRIVIRNQELIPADAILIRGHAYIDYSFVTGESEPVPKISGDQIYAGGKQIGGALELDIIRQVNQSYLTELWNDDAFVKHNQSKITSVANTVSHYFTIIVISIALFAAWFWAGKDWNLALNAFSAVLIVACPCALALSTPFTLGNALRILGWNKFYLKNTAVIEALAAIDQIAFDKTGTITRGTNAQIEFHGPEKLRNSEYCIIHSLVRQSMHPLSQHLAKYLSNYPLKPVEKFNELTGKGIRAEVDGQKIILGSAEYISVPLPDNINPEASKVFLAINGRYRGYFALQNAYRSGLEKVISSLTDKMGIQLLTGDTDRDQVRLIKIFMKKDALHFKQTPQNKLNFIKALQQQGKKVLMVGDGLNDAGALKQSDVGITVTESINSFSPASDAILDAKSFERLPDFIGFAKSSMRVILVSFIISFLYNIVGMYFAVGGTLSPLIAAVLMPASSISVVVFSTLSVVLIARKMGLKIKPGIAVKL